MQPFKNNQLINIRIDEISKKIGNQVSERELNELATLIYPKLKYYIFTFCKNEFDTCEATQFTLKKIFKNLDKFDSEKGKFTTWIFRIARNESLYYLFYKKRDECLNIDDYSSTNNNSPKQFNFFPQTEEKNFSLVDDLYDKTTNEILNLADDQLREIAILKIIKNKKIKDIAIETGINENTVKTKLRKIKVEIKKTMFDKYPYIKEKLNQIL
jgi:RNA polymerase sigma factor (sigma-70 family)